MLDEGAGELGALELADELDLLGAHLSSFAGRESAEIRLGVLRKNLDRAPRFDPREWDRLQTLTVNDLRQRRDIPAAVARVVLVRSFFGDGHPYAAPISGYAETAAGLTLEEAQAFHRER
jgi:predicted Zn-dependent peptidase